MPLTLRALILFSSKRQEVEIRPPSCKHLSTKPCFCAARNILKTCSFFLIFNTAVLSVSCKLELLIERMKPMYNCTLVSLETRFLKTPWLKVYDDLGQILVINPYYNPMNHKNYNFLDCDWFKNPLIHLSSFYRTVC